MAELDTAILEALYAAIEKMKRDPGEAARRARRAAASGHRLPRAPWRLALRANDTRIERHCDIDFPETARARGAHSVLLTCDAIVELCRPVRIGFPGIDWLVAADKLGISRPGMRHWMQRGVFVVSMCPPRAAGKRGKPVPYVYSRSPLDPQAALGRAPDIAWGTLWQHMAESVPVEHCWALRRHPEFSESARWGRPRRGGADAGTEDFVGWRWVCPGRIRPIPERMPQPQVRGLSAREEERRRAPGAGPLFADDWELTAPRVLAIHGRQWLHTPCGRLVKMVYLPIRPWTYPDARGLWEELGELGIPPPPNYSAQPFACQQCWQIQGSSTLTRQGWNEFIAHVTGGVLYGGEVARGCEDAQPRRIRRAHPRRASPQAAARRAEVLRLVVEGHTYGAIGRMLVVSERSVCAHVARLRAEHGVGSRGELVGKVGVEAAVGVRGGGAA